MGALQKLSTQTAPPRLTGNSLLLASVAIAGLAWATPAQAVYWLDDDPMQMSAEPPIEQAPRPKRIKRPAMKPEKQVGENVKPVGPLVISISVDRQHLKVFDANGLFAETPVSTGMKGHTTPMGAFSVIQKNKFHKSNIYSGAPMPFMQRITWSGIALHAGALPGYPASHGCIRMPMAFATKMWGWTRMGARVVITPGEISPVSFAHALLPTRKPDPAPVPMAAAPAADTPVVKAELAVADLRPAMTSASLELKPMDAERARAASDVKRSREQSQTADASGVITPMIGAAIKSDAAATPKPKEMLVTRRDVDADAARAIDLAMAEVKADVALPAAARPAEVKLIEVAAAPLPEAPKPDATSVVAPTVPAPAAITEAAPKRSGQIAVLISRKDGKMYVRQNFAPLFETPVTIAASDRPLGTHIFTAQAIKGEARAYQWSVVTLPAARPVARADDDDSRTRRRRSTGAVEVTSAPVPNSAAEALDRLTIPAEAMAQIAESLASGSSIIVSDLGINAGGETGQGTEFVVPLR